jgi:RimJ/RimL family protein N-acetyltransferase
MTPPTLTTARLTLRPQRVEDFEPFAALLATDRARYMTRPLSRDTAWTWFCADEASWTFHGHGALTITETATGTIVGQTGILLPPRFPERELGWLLYDGMTGKGYATEAAGALLDWAWAQGMTTLVSYVDPDNRASHAVAQRLGAVRDTVAKAPDDGDVVWRHSPGAVR